MVGDGGVSSVGFMSELTLVFNSSSTHAPPSECRLVCGPSHISFFLLGRFLLLYNIVPHSPKAVMVKKCIKPFPALIATCLRF